METTIRELTLLDVPKMVKHGKGLADLHPMMYQSFKRTQQHKMIQLIGWKNWGEFADDELLTWVQFCQWNPELTGGEKLYHWHATFTSGVRPGALFDIMKVAHDWWELIHHPVMYTLRPTDQTTPLFCNVEGSPYADHDAEVVELIKAHEMSVNPMVLQYMTPYPFDKDYEVIKMTKRSA